MPSKQAVTTINNKQLFLNNYPKLLNTRKTASALGFHESTVYKWLESDKAFSQAYHELKKVIDTERLEEIELEIQNRAMGGTSKQSDILLMFVAKALDPGKYRERAPVGLQMIGDIIIKSLVPEYDKIGVGNAIKQGTDESTQETR